jgi:amino acid transporter
VLKVVEQDAKDELKRALTVTDLIIYGMVYMLPIAPFALFGIIDRVAHGYVALAYVMSAVALSFTARSYMVLSKEFPTAGSVYTYATKGLGQVAGFFAGWLVFLDYIISPCILAVVSAAAMNRFVPAIPRWAWIFAFVGLGTSLNLVGVNITAKANKIMLFAMLAVLLIFVVAGSIALYGGKGHGEITLAAFYSPSTFRWGAIGTAVLLASTNVLGFDAITTLGEEVRHDHKHLLGFAGMATLVLTIALFVIQTWLATDLAPGAVINSPDTAFYDIALYAGGPWLFALVSIGTAISYGLPCAIVSQTAIARIIFAMGRDRQLPHIFARVGKKSQQPYVANLFVATVTLTVALFFQNRLDELALFQNFGAFGAFALVNISVVGYFWVKKGARQIVPYLIMPIIGLMIIITLLVAMQPATLNMGAIWLTVGVLYYLFQQRVLGRQVTLEV